MPAFVNRETIIELCLDHPTERGLTLLHFGLSPIDASGAEYEKRAKEVVSALVPHGFIGKEGKRYSQTNLVETVLIVGRDQRPANREALAAKLRELFPDYEVKQDSIRFSGQDTPIVTIDILPLKDEDEESENEDDEEALDEEDEDEDPDEQER